jgi:predicted metalloprotease
VQDELGVLSKVDAQRERMSEADSNKLSIRIELQADCYAGMWARDEEKRGFIDVGDIDEALNAAAEVGDDAIQKREQGYAVPETFNHGTSVRAPAGSSAVTTREPSTPAIRLHPAKCDRGGRARRVEQV